MLYYFDLKKEKSFTNIIPFKSHNINFKRIYMQRQHFIPNIDIKFNTGMILTILKGV